MWKENKKGKVQVKLWIRFLNFEALMKEDDGKHAR